ncbi:chemotaxis protein CheW [Marinibactrum halimedae]|uniref:CheW-like domain-containing protein n=1 Tax=Marinibactrum halimedae TaxID=1444977 RepID=A0AA37TBG0_9GAMM|nr:chemotaxis protein CheW [Marinibactrum halimedae]MCD9459812.1 chemotaxis protein CheW [Marinibactrum halimedae]GLS26995.1 hypothetical protein GCM10007877_27140 [Marinibactrum halimedae]
MASSTPKSPDALLSSYLDSLLTEEGLGCHADEGDNVDEGDNLHEGMSASEPVFPSSEDASSESISASVSSSEFRINGTDSYESSPPPEVRVSESRVSETAVLPESVGIQSRLTEKTPSTHRAPSLHVKDVRKPVTERTKARYESIGSSLEKYTQTLEPHPRVDQSEPVTLPKSTSSATPTSTTTPNSVMSPTINANAVTSASMTSSPVEAKPQHKMNALSLPREPEPVDDLLAQKRAQVEKLLKGAVAKPLIETKVDTKIPEVEVKARVDVGEQQDVEAKKPLKIKTDIDTRKTIEVAPTEVATPAEPDAEVISQSDAAVDSHLEWCENGRPQWAQNRFEVLLFSVSGLTLAVPLVSLGTIHPLTDELTPLFGQADWFMGLQPTAMGKIRTVNTALFVMPERYKPEFSDSFKYVMSIDGLPWGLAVDEVKQPISLDPDEVNWRSGRGKRAWLAGTVKTHMCALLDIPKLGHELEVNDKNKQPKS